jgi:hypothetical protein
MPRRLDQVRRDSMVRLSSAPNHSSNLVIYSGEECDDVKQIQSVPPMKSSPVKSNVDAKRHAAPFPVAAVSDYHSDNR